MKKLHNGNGGFSLVELIVAVVILGIITVPLLHTLLTGAQTAKKSADASDCTAAAQSLMELVRAKGAGRVFENVGLVGATFDAANSTDTTKIGKISDYTSGTRQYSAVLQITTDPDDTTALAKSNPMDITFNMKYADGKAVNDFYEACKSPVYQKDADDNYVLDADGNKIIDHWVPPDYNKLQRDSIRISATRVPDAEGNTYDYTVTVELRYSAAVSRRDGGGQFSETVSSVSSLTGVSETEFGQAAFSVYLIYDAFAQFGTKTNAKDIITISNGEEINGYFEGYSDADFNVFLVNGSTGTKPENFSTEVEYYGQRFSGESTCVRVFSNLEDKLEDKKVTYRAFKNRMPYPQSVSSYLVETATENRRFLVSVTLYSAGSFDESNKILTLDAEMLI